MMSVETFLRNNSRSVVRHDPSFGEPLVYPDTPTICDHNIDFPSNPPDKFIFVANTTRGRQIYIYDEPNAAWLNVGVDSAISVDGSAVMVAENIAIFISITDVLDSKGIVLPITEGSVAFSSNGDTFEASIIEAGTPTQHISILNQNQTIRITVPFNGSYQTIHQEACASQLILSDQQSQEVPVFLVFF